MIFLKGSQISNWEFAAGSCHALEGNNLTTPGSSCIFIRPDHGKSPVYVDGHTLGMEYHRHNTEYYL